MIAAAIAVPTTLAVSATCLTVATVNGSSMSPTLENDDVILISRNIGPSFSSMLLQRIPRLQYETSLTANTIVVFKDPNEYNGNLIVKRCAAVEGETIKKVQNTTFGRSVQWKYLGPGKMWVTSDNKSPGTSFVDSENGLGEVYMGLVVGKAIGIVWPPSRFQLFAEPKEEGAKDRELKRIEDILAETEKET